MSESRPLDPDADAAHDPDAESEAEALRMELALLAEENRQLRESYAQARQTRYRRAALALVVIGAVAVGGGLVFPAARSVLFVLGAIGVFGAVLTYYLTPERFVPASVGAEVYATLAEVEREIVDQLGLTDHRLYVPIDRITGAGVRLYIPQRESYAIPDETALGSPFVVTDDDHEFGLSVPPTGGSLFEEFERTLSDPLADDPVLLVDQLVEGLVEVFELAAGVETDVNPDGRATVRIAESTFGAVDRIDHPASSFLAVGLAVGLDTEIATEATTSDDGAYIVTYRWGSAIQAAPKPRE